MRANRRRDTAPEVLVRRLLHRRGLRFRVDYRVSLDSPCRPVRPDIAFTRLKVAVFIDGCFWHGCPIHGRRTTTRNQHYWGPKIARNRERDGEQAKGLANAGWRVLRFWEHEDPAQISEEIARTVEDARRALCDGP